jgi:MFS family permease
VDKSHDWPSRYRIAAGSRRAQREFLFFWLAGAISTLAVQIESVALGWQAYDVARRTLSVEESAFRVGLVGLAQFVPLCALSLLSGSVADRADRRAVLLLCTAAELLCALGLTFIARMPSAGLGFVFMLAAAFGAARAFASPASAALGPMLVPRAQLPTAISRIALADQASAIIGPSLGGILCAGSTASAYAGAAALYAGALIALLAMHGHAPPTCERISRWAHIREGLAYVWSNRLVRGAISLDLFAVLLGGVGALLPVYARDVLHAGAHGFGVLRAGPAAGAAVMAYLLARHPLNRRAGRWLFGGVAAYGAATLIFAVSRSFALSVCALAALGAADMISVYVRQSLVQIATPDAMRGRVAAVASLFIGGSAELGEFETGAAARLLGPVGAAIFGGVGSLLVTGAWSAMFPALRDADRLDSADEASTDQAGRRAA